MEPAESIAQRPFITLHHIYRRFGSVLANQDISLDLFEGEVHAIVGENGAGKSTLMKILNGELQPDAGEIRLNGRRTTLRRPQEAIQAGIGMAHQNFLIFPHLTALENIIAGKEPGAWGWIRRNQANDELLELCRSVGFALPLDAPASRLSFAHRQQIEILRLLYRKVKVLIFDEPTSLLAPPETERFLSLLRTLQAAGHTILFISHRLHEVFAVADRVSVLSRGRCAGTYLKSEITVDRLVQLVVSGSNAGSPGKTLPKADASGNVIQLQTSVLTGKTKQPTDANRHHNATPHSSLLTPHSSATPFLELREVTTRAFSHEGSLDRFSLEVLKGEIFGLGGVVGNGQRALALLLSGILPAERGTVVFSGREITHLSTSERIAMGLRWLPANPQEEALLPSRSLWENLLLGRQRQPPLQHYGWLNRKLIKPWATDQLDRNGVAYASLDDPLRYLSGGNLQKLALSRVLEGSPDLVIMEQPSRGLDIRAQEHLREKVWELNKRGITFVLISYDLDELLGMSHHIGVLYRGRMMGIATPSEASREQLGSWMLGVETRNSKLETGE
jgi:general nucleoside transport system ATP-binding protein